MLIELNKKQKQERRKRKRNNNRNYPISLFYSSLSLLIFLYSQLQTGHQDT